MINKDTIDWFTKLQNELSFIKTNHPQLTAIIGLVEGQLKGIQMASGPSTTPDTWRHMICRNIGDKDRD
jgi:hypothetical protein